MAISVGLFLVWGSLFVEFFVYKLKMFEYIISKNPCSHCTLRDCLQKWKREDTQEFTYLLQSRFWGLYIHYFCNLFNSPFLRCRNRLRKIITSLRYSSTMILSSEPARVWQRKQNMKWRSRLRISRLQVSAVSSSGSYLTTLGTTAFSCYSLFPSLLSVPFAHITI